MKFLDTLNSKYEELQLDKPQWLREYTAVPAVAPTTTGQTLQKVASTVAGVTPTGGVVSALMKAMDVLQDDPDVQKLKTDITQKVADAKKQITAAGTKTVDDISKAVSSLQKVVKPAGAGQPQSVPTSIGTI